MINFASASSTTPTWCNDPCWCTPGIAATDAEHSKLYREVVPVNTLPGRRLPPLPVHGVHRPPAASWTGEMAEGGAPTKANSGGSKRSGGKNPRVAGAIKKRSKLRELDKQRKLSKRALKSASKKRPLPAKLVLTGGAAKGEPDGGDGAAGDGDGDGEGKGKGKAKQPRPQKKRARGELTEDAAAEEAAAIVAKQKSTAVAKLKKQKADPLKAAEFKAMRERSQRAASLPAAEAADWVWDNHVLASAAAPIEREGFGAEHMLPMPDATALGGALKAALAGASREYKVAAPVALLLGGSAVGCNNAAKALRDPGLGPVAKLFAKHIKPAAQQAFLAAHPTLLFGVATPNRLLKLLEMGALSLERLALVVLDVQADMKRMTVLDLRETRLDFSRLFAQALLPRLASGATKLCLADCSQLPR
eukprot:jgi/Tetstr1/428343/TSEL_018378.t1